MNSVEFEVFLEDTLNEIREAYSNPDFLNEVIQNVRDVLGSKAKEYATNDNRFENFDLASTLKGESAQSICLSYTLKHFTSLMVLDKKLIHPTDIPESVWKEKCIDHINYIILFLGIIRRGFPHQKEIKERFKK